MAHGGGAVFGFTAPRTAPAVAARQNPLFDPKDFEGFSYLLGQPSPAQRTALGANPARARQILEALYSLLPTHELPSGLPAENPHIPAGYTYLLQLVAHDLVDTTVPFWVAAESGIPSRNMRSASLQLDTLYGGAPTTCPMAYTPAGGQPDDRSELRLGRIGDAATLPGLPGPCLARDLPRLIPKQTPPSGNFDDAAQVYAADIRSDDSVILAQLVALFSILHNAIGRLLPGMTAQARFTFARTAMLQMYYAVIRHDLLPRLLHREVYEILSSRPAASDAWVWQDHRVPLEFTHGAFRVGHAMVRPFYQFNAGNQFSIFDVVGGPNFGSAVRDPLPAAWIVAWGKFFEFAGDRPNYSLRLAVRQQQSLDFANVLPDVVGNTPATLSVRDWLSAAAARSWRHGALAAALGPRYPGLRFIDAKQIACWLAELTKSGSGLDDARSLIRTNIAGLAADLPLPLYILLESEYDREIAGQHMGSLGSIIVGEVVFRRLAEQEAKLAPLAAELHNVLGDELWNRIAGVTDMPALVRLAAEWGNLGDCRTIPFITAPKS